jgi:hypothetical protein
MKRFNLYSYLLKIRTFILKTKIFGLIFSFILVPLIIFYYVTNDIAGTNNSVPELLDLNLNNFKGFIIPRLIYSLEQLQLLLNNNGYNVNFLISIKDFLNLLNDKDSFKQLYKYLDSIGLYHEIFLINVLGLILIIVLITSLSGALLANEIINFFNLEKKFPKLKIILDLRIKFQKYYLLSNIIQIYFACIILIAVDIFAFIYLEFVL